MPFGIPTLDEAASLMEGAIQDSNTDFLGIGHNILTSLGNSAVDNRADLNTIQGRLRSKLGHSVRFGENHLDKVGNVIDVNLSNAIAQSMTDLPPAAPHAPPRIPPHSMSPPSVPVQPPGTMPPGAPPAFAGPEIPSAPGAPPIVPLPPTNPGAPPPQPGGFVAGWYCSPQSGVIWAVPADFGTGPQVIAYMYLSPTDTQAIGTISIAELRGPFPDKLTAERNCGANPPPPPPIQIQPPPPAPIVTITPPPTNGQASQPTPTIMPQNVPPSAPVPQCQGVIPPIGSEEFCRQLPAIKETLHTLGKTVIDWVMFGLVPQIDLSEDQSLVQSIVGSATNPLSSIGPAVLQTLVDQGTEYVKQLKQRIDDLQSMFSCVASCDADALFSIAVVKTAISILKKFRIGTDALVWATFDGVFEVRPIEQAIDYVLATICPSEIPQIGETIETYNRGLITDEQYACWMMMRGADPVTWEPVRQSRRDRLTPDQIMQYARRVGVTDQGVTDYLRSLGFTNPDDKEALKTLYDKLPTIGDHLHWLQRNVFSTEYVQQYHLLDGFARDEVIRLIPGFGTYQSLAVPQRGFFWDEFGADLYAQGMKIEYAARHYAAHWIMPSPEQMKQFVYRLRPDRVPPDLVFTTADYDRILQEQDYNVLARRWFVATVNPVPAISYVKRMFQLGVIDATQLKAYHMDLGYAEQDATNFVGVDKIDRIRHWVTSGHGWTPQAMANAYAIGQLTVQNVYDGMDDLGYPRAISDQLLARSTAEFDRLVLTRARSRALYQMATTVKQAITAGTMTVQDGTLALVNMGWPLAYSQAIASLADVAARANMTKTAVSRIRSAYRSGEVTIEDAALRLSELGIIADRVNQLTTQWQIENTPNRKRRTAAQIVSDTASGHVSVEEALARLTNLGYEDADKQLFMADVQGKQAKMEASAMQANIKAGRQRAAQLAANVRQAQRARTQALNALRRVEPVAKLQKWLRLNIITEDYFAGRMALYGYSPGEIEAYKAEALSQAKQARTPAAPAGPGGP